MPTFAELAPIVSGSGITQVQVDNYFTNIQTSPSPQPDPTITKAKIQALADAVYGVGGIEGAGGISQLASTIGLSVDQVKKILAEFSLLYAQYLESNP